MVEDDESKYDGVPFQVVSLMKSMLDQRENIHVRGNFRSRLAKIREVIDATIKVYDNELARSNVIPPRKSRTR